MTNDTVQNPDGEPFSSIPASSNLILIGMPSAGKSTVGVVLAKMLGMDFLDGDLLIQRQEGATLPQLIDELGPEGFLMVENRVLSGVACENTVIATGGSAVYSEEAMAHLRELGRIIYLRISYDEMARRLGDIHQRGVVMRKGAGMSLRDMYEERLPLYDAWADLTMDADGLTLAQVARELFALVKKDDVHDE
ncbi:MAG: shikimate kinase [Eggerthellaceae bacterium]|nr:shikimate kinase [Eggerthellaceae bacterium]